MLIELNYIALHYSWIHILTVLVSGAKPKDQEHIAGTK